MSPRRRPKVTFRAIHRDPDGNENTSEREVECASNEEMLGLLCQPWDALPESPDPVTSERWKDTLSRLDGWMSALSLELVEETSSDGERRWRFGVRPAADERDASPSGRPAEQSERARTQVEASGHVHADVYTDRGGTVVRLNDGGPGIQVDNHGLMVWNRDNIYVQMQLVANISVHTR
jgi:hypothetical protein